MMTMRFWGVRGSLPSPGPATLRYGGNTICVALRCGPHLLILDAGSGLRALGNALADAGEATDADLLLSHTHLDHICGLPFFQPVYDPRARLRIWGGHLTPPDSIAAAVRRSLREPLMPNIDAAFRASVSYHDFTAGDAPLVRPSVRVETIALRHPGGSIGYRINWAGASLCYVTDTELLPGRIDAALVAFVAGADVLIQDSTYTDVEYLARVGWGHSTWQEAVRLADAAAVRTLVLFHHDPAHDDAAMDEIAAAAAEHRPGTLVAQESMEITISGFGGVVAELKPSSCP